MQIDNASEELFAALTTPENPQFEPTWATFIFDIDKLKTLLNKDMLKILNAGLQFNGGGLSTGTLSKRLFQVSGVAMVKSTFAPYRDAWLLGMALLSNLELPALEAAPDVAEAAFALTAAIEGEPWPDEGQAAPDKELEAVFDWDEPASALPKELQELWARSTRPEQKIDLKALLSAVPRFTGLPSRAPENNLLPAQKKKEDAALRAASQTVLHSLRILANNYVKEADPQLQARANLQVWQVLAELYHKLQGERKDLAVPGFCRTQNSGGSGDLLFTEEDVKSQRLEKNIQQISMGGQICQPSGHTFRSSTEPGQQYQFKWRGSKGGFKGAKGGFKGGFRSSFKGGWKGGRGKGVHPPPCIPCQGDVRGPDHGGRITFGPGRPFSTSQGGFISFGRAGSLSKTQALFSMVGEKCPPQSSETDHGRGRTPFSGATSSSQRATQVSGGDRPGLAGDGRVCGSQGSQGGSLLGYKVPSSLVCSEEIRASGGRKTQAHFRLSRDKSRAGAPSFQIR